jgi:hypothetical protein
VHPADLIGGVRGGRICVGCALAVSKLVRDRAAELTAEAWVWD